ncbi:hypothetical protein MMC12_006895 [Toensbergia leucococca]|nr:hypothetical protein [Toensbergia leucococca]
MASLMTINLIGASALLLLLTYKYIIYPVFLSPLSKIPNAHFTSPILSTWIQWKKGKGPGTRAIYALHQKLGPVVRLGPNTIHVNTAAALRTVYVGGFEKPEYYQNAFMNYGIPNLVSMMENKPHSIQKRMMSNVYSKSFLQASPDVRAFSNSIIFNRFLPVVQQAAQSDSPSNVFDLMQALGMDFTSAYLFGSSNGSNFLLNVDFRRQWLDTYKVFVKQRPEDRANGLIEKWCYSLCEAADAMIKSEKPASSTSTKAIVYGQLSKGLEVIVPSLQSKIATAASEMLDHLVAGHETSAITMTYLMHELSRQPALQSKLRDEVLTLAPQLIYPTDSSTGPNTTKDPLPSPRSIDTLPLLDAMLQETLRLYAAAPAPQPRITPFSSTPTTIESFTIPGGVQVSAAAYCIHRNPSVFPEPQKWIPERWLQEKTKTDEMRRWFWPFSSGGRMCLGSNLAIQEMKLAMVAIYTNYTTTIVDDEGIEQADDYISRPVGNKLILRMKHV